MTPDKTTVDHIEVKRLKTDNVEMYQLFSDVYGAASGQTVPEALRELADAVELDRDAHFAASNAAYIEVVDGR